MSSIYFIAFKYLITAGLVVLVSELVKYTGKFGAFIAALPTVTVLTLVWLYIEGQPQERISEHAWYTLWYVIPTLPMFFAFPFIYSRLAFWPTLLASAMLTMFCFGVFALIFRRFGIELI